MRDNLFSNRLLAIFFSFLCWLVLSTSLSLASEQTAQGLSNKKSDLTFTILHTNDLHSHDESFSEHNQPVGGIARIAQLIRSIKARTPNTIVIDAGDIFQGTPLFSLYKGEVEVELLNRAGYDIFTIGNHEFDEGAGNLAKQLSKAKFTIISCNLDSVAQPALASLFKPSVIRLINGQKVAFIGAMTPDLEQISLKTDGVKIKTANRESLATIDDLSWIEPIKTEVAKVKSLGINKIILVTHCGVDRDRQLAANLPDVDVIVGGHSHTRLSKPILYKHADGSTTLITQTGCYGRALGKLNLTFDSVGFLVLDKSNSNLIDISGRLPEDQSIKAYLKEKAEPINALNKDIVATAIGDFNNHFRKLPGDSPLGNLICEALVEAGKDYGATISFQNRGGIRANLEKGPISEAKVQEILPFDNKVVFATLPGSTIRALMERSISGKRGDTYLDFTGLKFIYDPTKEAGHRILFIQAINQDGTWHDLKDDGQYRIAVNDFSFNGGEGYMFAGAQDIVKSTNTLAQVLSEYLKRHKTVAPHSCACVVPVSENLLTVANRNNGRCLQINAPKPGSKITLVVGQELGIGTIFGSQLIPVDKVKVVASKISSGKGEIMWPLSSKLLSKQKSQAKRFATVIIENNHSSKAIISSPVAL